MEEAKSSPEDKSPEQGRYNGEKTQSYLQDIPSLEVHIPKLNEITIPEEDKPFPDTLQANIKSAVPFSSSITRMLYAGGDIQTPSPESVAYISAFLKRLLNSLFSDEIANKVLKFHSLTLSKRVKFDKLLKYIEKMYRVETCVFFSSIEMKKSLRIEEDNREDGSNTKSTRKRIYKNPILRMENNMKLAKYDKIRRIRMHKKQERSKFNLERTKEFSAESMQFFEKCKEERFFRDSSKTSIEYFQNFLQANTSLDWDHVHNKLFAFGLVGYILSCSIKSVIEHIIRSRNEDHELHQLNSCISVDELKYATQEYLDELMKKQKILISCGGNRAEMMAYKIFKKEYEDYLDILLGDDRLLMKHKLEKLGDKYVQKSMLKQIVGDQIQDASMMDGIISRQEILKDQFLMQLLESPKQLWKNLNVRVRNAWINRGLISQKLRGIFKSDSDLAAFEEEEFRQKAILRIDKVNINGKYWPVLKSFLKSEILNCRGLSTFQRSLKATEKNAFQTYFFNYYDMEDDTLLEAQKASLKQSLELQPSNTGTSASQKKKRPKISKEATMDLE